MNESIILLQKNRFHKVRYQFKPITSSEILWMCTILLEYKEKLFCECMFYTILAQKN